MTLVKHKYENKMESCFMHPTPPTILLLTDSSLQKPEVKKFENIDKTKRNAVVSTLRIPERLLLSTYFDSS